MANDLQKVSITVTPDMLAQLDLIAKERGLSRTAAMRDLLPRGIESYRAERELLRRIQGKA